MVASHSRFREMRAPYYGAPPPRKMDKVIKLAQNKSFYNIDSQKLKTCYNEKISLTSNYHDDTANNILDFIGGQLGRCLSGLVWRS